MQVFKYATTFQVTCKQATLLVDRWKDEVIKTVLNMWFYVYKKVERDICKINQKIKGLSFVLNFLLAFYADHPVFLARSIYRKMT